MWRDLYSFACLAAASHHLELLIQGRPTQLAVRAATGSKRPDPSTSDTASSQQAVAAALRELDMAAIMGGPLFRHEVIQLITVAQTLHQKQMDANSNLPSVKRQRAMCDGDTTNAASNSEPHTYKPGALHGPDATGSLPRPVPVTSFVQGEGGFMGAAIASPQHQERASASQLLPPGSLQPQATQVPADHLPSLERCPSFLCLQHRETHLLQGSEHVLWCI